MPGTENATWLPKTYYHETLKIYAHVWDLYIKFYTVFLTANVLGLGLAVEHIPIAAHRWPIIAAFSIQNLITMGTSLGVARYSSETDIKLRKVAVYLAGSHSAERPLADAVKGSPIPVKLSKWAGLANCIASAIMIGCWIALRYI